MRQEQLQLINKNGLEFKVDFYGLDNLNPEKVDLRPLVLLFPGGYFAYYSKKEIDPVVTRLLAQGMQVAVVYYSLVNDAGGVYPDAALSGLAAVEYFRENSYDFLVDPNRIITMGFSAGGHVAAIINAMLEDSGMQNEFDLSESMQPNATILAYPFIDIEKLGFKLTPEQMAVIPKNPLFHDAAKGVTDKTPPTFVVHATADPIVPVANGISYFLALQEHNVDAEGLFLQGKVHGFSTATPDVGLAGNADLVDAHLAHWFDMAMEWVNKVLR